VISSLTALFIVFAAVIGSVAMMGILAYFLTRIRQIESRSSGEAGSSQLADQVNGLREDLLTVQEELSLLSERLDFTEKLLTTGDDTAVADDSV